MLYINRRGSAILVLTLRISNVIGLGPLDENQTTYGADSSLVVILLSMVAIGSLSKKLQDIWINGVTDSL